MSGQQPLQESDSPMGYQWIIAPNGHRWKVVGLGTVVAHLEDAEGRRFGLGRSILREGLASGAWREAEFEEVSDV